MTNLINMSNFGRLRDLINLRLDQETAIRMKDEEIETLQATEERLNEQIIRLDLELWNASLDIHSQRESSAGDGRKTQRTNHSLGPGAVECKSRYSLPT